VNRQIKETQESRREFDMFEKRQDVGKAQSQLQGLIKRYA